MSYKLKEGENNMVTRKMREKLEGYQFTGIYNFDKEKCKERAKEIRAEGFKARVVNDGSGFSVYAEDAYHLTERLNKLNQMLASVPQREADAQSKYVQTLAEIKQFEKDCKSEIERISDLLKE